MLDSGLESISDTRTNMDVLTLACVVAEGEAAGAVRAQR